MLDSMFSRGSIGALESRMAFAGQRHRVIAGNIANVDTVGYKTLDVPVADFERSLAKAFAAHRTSTTGAFELPSSGRVRSGPDGLRLRTQEAADAGILKHIENNVDLDIEMAKMVKNQSLHSTAAALLAQQFGLLRSAIMERVV
jgi:flagellar basal-body rod protein FlgB